MVMIEVLTAWIAIFFANLTLEFVGNLLSLMVIGFIGVSLYKMHHNPDSKFDITELFIDKRTGNIGGSEFRMNIAFFVTSWSLVYCILKNQSIEIVLGSYLAAWVFDRYNSRKSSIQQIVQKNKEGDKPE